MSRKIVYKQNQLLYLLPKIDKDMCQIEISCKVIFVGLSAQSLLLYRLEGVLPKISAREAREHLHLNRKGQQKIEEMEE